MFCYRIQHRQVLGFPTNTHVEFIIKGLTANQINGIDFAGADGTNYERLAIKQWFSTHNTSPLTNLTIENTLIPNRTLKEETVEWLDTHRATGADDAAAALAESATNDSIPAVGGRGDSGTIAVADTVTVTDGGGQPTERQLESSVVRTPVAPHPPLADVQGSQETPAAVAAGVDAIRPLVAVEAAHVANAIFPPASTDHWSGQPDDLPPAYTPMSGTSSSTGAMHAPLVEAVGGSPTLSGSDGAALLPGREASDALALSDEIVLFFQGLGLRPSHIEIIAPLIHETGATEPEELAVRSQRKHCSLFSLLK